MTDLEKEAFPIALTALFFALNVMWAAQEGAAAIKHGAAALGNLSKGDFKGALGNAGRSGLNAALAALSVSVGGGALKSAGRALKFGKSGLSGLNLLNKAKKTKTAASIAGNAAIKASYITPLKTKRIAKLHAKALKSVNKAQRVQKAAPSARTLTSSVEAYRNNNPRQAALGTKLLRYGQKTQTLPGVRNVMGYLKKHPVQGFAGVMGGRPALDMAFPNANSPPINWGAEWHQGDTNIMTKNLFNPINNTQRADNILAAARKFGQFSPQINYTGRK